MDILSSWACSLTEGYLIDICEDEKQLMYTRCSYVYPSGSQCSNPIPRHLDPPLCGGHCDSVEPPKLEETADISTSGSGEAERDFSVTEQVAAIDSDRTSTKFDQEMCTWRIYCILAMFHYGFQATIVYSSLEVVWESWGLIDWL